ncbi:hypothetical protein [Faecalispora anaeroviscerum]|uniref:hypothetical protein n=1 Tax=Faecalispora anaeroviscerum TaxID=2991836 RepID=UPI0024B951B8|nr:hypothetical protein [Faecalispora anaeroviscerum]
MKKTRKKWIAAVLSLGLMWTAVPFQTAQAATSEQTVDVDITSTSSFKFTAATLSEIEYILTNDRENVRVQLNFESTSATSKAVQDMSSITVPKSTLQAIEKSGKKATFEIYSQSGDMEYAWEFSSGKMDTLTDINLALKVANVSTVTLTDPITVNSAVIQMKHTAALPKNTVLILPMDKGDDTKTTYPVFYDLDNAEQNSFYLYKLSGSKLSYVTGSKFKLNDDDEFKVGISNGGSYVLTPTNLGLSGSGSSGNISSGSTTDSVQLSGYSGTVAVGGTTSIFIQKPTSGTFTVTSGNPNVAQVLGSGASVNGGTQYQVQGLSAGTSVFTVKSSNGTSTSYTLTVSSAATPTTKSGWVMIDTDSYQFAPGNIYDYKVTLSGAAASEVQTASSRPHIASVKELRRETRSDGLVDVYYRITALRASADPTTVSSTVRGVHSSIRVMVTAGIKQNGVAARNLSYFTS